MRELALVLVLVTGCDRIIRFDENKDAALLPPNEAAIDAPFDPAGCPAGYDGLPGLPNSKYKFVQANNRYSSHASACILDGTHLVLIESQAEGFAIDKMLDMLGTDAYFWVGLGQDAGASTIDGGWTWASGRAVDPVMWGDGEPDDGDDGSEGHDEDRAMIARFGTGMDLIDAPAEDAHFAICECDGVIVK